MYRSYEPQKHRRMNTQLLENDDDVPPLVELCSQSESDDEHDFASRGHVSHAELP